MTSYQRKGSHTVSRLSCHIVWSIKYRYKVLKGDIKRRFSSDHIHMHIEYTPKQSISSLVKQMKGRTSRKLQLEPVVHLNNANF